MLKIVQSPDPLLNQVCEPCETGDRSLKKLAKQMERVMYATDGVGIAAPQVGILKRLIVVETTPDDEDGARNPLALVNPEIIETWGDPEVNDEGCLSCPGIYVPIERQPWARVRYQDFKGEEWEIESDGLLGRCLQHEIDHLNGITLFERATPIVRIKALKAYEEAKRLGAQPGDVSVEKLRVR